MTTFTHPGWYDLKPIEPRSTDREWEQGNRKSPNLRKNGRTHAETVALRKQAGYGNNRNHEVKLGQYFDGSTK